MHLLRLLIRENLQDPEREHFGFTPEGLDALVRELLQYFQGEWTLTPSDPETRQIQRKFGLPVEFIPRPQGLQGSDLNRGRRRLGRRERPRDEPR